MPDYSKGKIYTIRCKNDPSLIYVGSTIQPLSVRFGGHKIDSKREKYKSTLLYTKIEDWNDWYIELYLNFPCNSVEELRKKEGEVIREIGTLNKIIAGRTKKEYREDNKDRYKEYREENKEKIQETIKKYREENKTKIQEKVKQYYENNKEKILLYAKQYYNDNLEGKKEYRKQSFTCACGGHFTISHKTRHEATKIHLNFISNQQASKLFP